MLVALVLQSCLPCFCVGGISHVRLELVSVGVQWVVCSAEFMLFLGGEVAFD